MVARKLLAILRLPLQFPVGKTRLFPLDHPEIVPVAVIVVATKLCFPFAADHHPLLGQDNNSIPLLDWTQWMDGIGTPMEDRKQAEKEPNFDGMTPGRVVAMTDEELDAYFAHISSLVDKKSKIPGLSSRQS